MWKHIQGEEVDIDIERYGEENRLDGNEASHKSDRHILLQGIIHIE